jgi:iron complex outermembrane recepter protein
MRLQEARSILIGNPRRVLEPSFAASCKALLSLGLAFALAPCEVGAFADARELSELTLEELGNVMVTSVSRREEPVFGAPASIYVITAEDIRRSGVTSLPEALRLAPNLEVARIDSSDYAISARGFNSSTANKLLVLIDGRSVYTPLFSGVFWDAQSVMLEDVERIEVISGPGGTLWGTNAVNGVINVITRSSRETTGALVSGGGGNLEKAVAARYGTALGENGNLRVYGRFFDRQHTERADGTAVPDDWNKSQMGFRGDWGDGSGLLTVQGDAYQGNIEQAAPGTTEISGANLLARWTRQFDGGSSLRLQGYVDHTARDIPGTFGEQLDIFDVELQHSWQARAHHVVWGAGYRSARDRVDNGPVLAFLPADVNLAWTNLFGQDTIALGKNLETTFGVRVEHNSYTGVEVLPSARLAWKPVPEHLLWTAVSRAVRTPSRIDREFFIFVPPLPLTGGADFESEIADVVEVGYRAQPVPRLSYSVTVFKNFYDKLRSVEPAGGGSFVIQNKMGGTGTGAEAWGTWRATDKWRLSAGGFVLHQDLKLDADSADPLGVSAAGNDPEYQWMLRSALDVTRNIEFDLAIRHVAKLPSPAVPAYTSVDARIGWRPSRELEISLAGTNLFDPRHPEFGAAPLRSELQRGAYAELTWRY